MTTTNQQLWRLAKLPLAVSLASVLAAPAFAVNFNIGEIEGSFDFLSVCWCHLVNNFTRHESCR